MRHDPSAALGLIVGGARLARLAALWSRIGAQPQRETWAGCVMRARDHPDYPGGDVSPNNCDSSVPKSHSSNLKPGQPLLTANNQ